MPVWPSRYNGQVMAAMKRGTRLSSNRALPATRFFVASRKPHRGHPALRILVSSLLLGLLPSWAFSSPNLPKVMVPALGSAEARGAAEKEPRLLRLRQEISDILRMRALQRVRVGLEVLEAKSGVELVHHNADVPFNPASNTKILTTAAALDSLGPDFRYRTVFLAQGDTETGKAPLSAGILHGDLFLQGSGDPSLTPEGLADLVRNLHSAGIERIEGEVRLDNQLRDLSALAAAAAEAPTHGPGALILSGDRYAVHVSPGEVGHNATVWIGPRLPYFVVHNQVRTVRGKRSRIIVEHHRHADQLVVTVRGRIGVKSPSLRVRKRLSDSSAWAVATLVQALSDYGIAVRDGVRLGPPPRGPLTVVAEHTSEPLSRICRVINKDSNNFVADTLFKTLGAARYGLPGTLEKGARAIADWLPPLGLDPARFHLVNGSGLTHENRLRPADLGQLLYRLYHSLDLGPEFLQSLAVGGIDGTISHRFHGSATGFVRGKTGTLSGVSVLSGYVGDRPGVMIFCIFVEGFHGRRLAAIRQAQAQIVEALLRFVRDGHPEQRPRALPAAGEPAGPVEPPPAGESPAAGEPGAEIEDDEA